jgi:hypothetical protein
VTPYNTKILNLDNHTVYKQAFKPFNKISLDFIEDLRTELKKNKKIYEYPELAYFIFWLRKSKIKKILDDFKDKNLRHGRGLVFHVSSSNLPTNFIYSFIFGLLSGNSNIVKIPSISFPEKEILISAIDTILKKKKYDLIKKTNLFINLERNSENFFKISKHCDARVIWGGDNSVKSIRNIPIKPRSIELVFPDRYSFCIIKSSFFYNQHKKKLELAAEKLFRDTYNLSQLACNSPHFIFIAGKIKQKNLSLFWQYFLKIIKKKVKFENYNSFEKFNELTSNIIKINSIASIDRFENYLYLVNLDSIDEIEQIRGKNGTFYVKKIKKINELKKYITEKCQTITYLGFSKNEMLEFVKKNNLNGVDRIVPIGQAMDIDVIWDGYETLKHLSRVITVD